MAKVTFGVRAATEAATAERKPYAPTSSLVTVPLSAGVRARAGPAHRRCPGRGRQPPPSPASLHARAAAAARAALRHLSIGEHATDHAVRGHAVATKGLTQVDSTNWSGYADDNSTGNTYSTVTGNWTEPTVTCSGSTESLAAFWVGIDGFTSGSVEQDGTLAECYFGPPTTTPGGRCIPPTASRWSARACGPETASAHRWSGAAAATPSRSPIRAAPLTASPPRSPAQAARTPAPSGSPKRRAVPAAFSRFRTSIPGR